MSTSTETETTPLLKQRPSTHRSNSEHYAEAVLDQALHYQADINGSAFSIGVGELEDTDEEMGSSDEEGDDDDDIPLKDGTVLIMLGMFIGGFLAALDGTIVVASLGVIGAEFSVSNTIGWVGTSYMMTQTAAQPLYGTFSDIFGRRPATLFSSTVFLLGSLGCGISRTYPQLLAARAVAGIGGAGLGVMMAIVAGDMIPLRKRGLWQGYGNIAWNLGSALGGPIGGFCGDKLGWRWGFLIQVPLCILHFSLAYLRVQNSFDRHFDATATDTWKKLKQVDFIGSFTMIGAIATGLVGLSLGGNQLPWDSPVVLGCLGTSISLLIAFGIIEAFLVSKPLLAPELLFSRSPGFIALTSFFTLMGQLAVFYSIPLWFSTIKGISNTQAGLHLIPTIITTSLSSLATGYTMNKTGKYKSLLVTAAVINIIGPLLMIFWDRTATPTICFWLTMPFVGLGFGSIITITVVALVSSVKPERMAASVSSSFLFRALGSVLGVALSSAVQQNALKAGLSKVITGPGSEKLIERLRGDMLYVWKLDADLRETVLSVYQDAGKTVFVACTLIAVCALITSLPIKETRLASRVDRK